MPKLHHRRSSALPRAPPRPSDLAVRHARSPRTPQDHFVQDVLALSEQGEGHPFELRVGVHLYVERTTYPPEGIFQDPDTHKLVLSIHPPLPTTPLVVHLDSYDGNDVDVPGAPLWASCIVASRESPMQIFCVANALRERAWRMGCQGPSDRAILILLRLAMVRYLDSFLKIHRRATLPLKLGLPRPRPRPLLSMVECIADKVSGMRVNMEALREADELDKRLHYICSVQ
ncbi:hypothetical protein LXA43DRAFT_1053854 [Ganoderma leucocontextum]|nr:hypothetical protein LXA43DRAFT_1053854 [Ganoderma leucocontextum]